jgi:hypothetical protein
MANKPMLAMAGALLSAVAMSGCESARIFYDGPKSYTPAPMPASMTYATPPTQWNNQIRTAAATSPAGVYNASAMKMDGTPGPVEVTSSLQMVTGVNGSPTPMLTITLPAVKFLVPINGTYSFTPPAGGSATTVASADAAAHGAPGMGAAPMENPLLRAGTPGQSTTIQYTPPTIQYTVPTSPNGAPSIQYTVPSGQTAAPTIQYTAPQPPAPQPNPAPQASQPLTSSILSQPAMGPRMADETVVTAKQPALLTPPPPPTWPRPMAEPVDGSLPDMAVPPPPPPIHRNAAGGQGSY